MIVICTKLDLVLLELASWNFHVKHQHLIYMHSCVHVHEKPQLSYVNYLHFSLSLQKKKLHVPVIPETIYLHCYIFAEEGLTTCLTNYSDH